MPYFPPVGGGVLLPNSIDNALLADMADGTVKGRPLGAGLGDPQDLTLAQLRALLAMPVAQCRLDYVSTTVLRLNRCNGCLLTIDNVPQVIPAAGVDLTTAGLTASAVYYVYAYMVGSVMTLGVVTGAAPVVDPRNGLKVKAGDPTMTLVGQFRFGADSKFYDQVDIRFTRTWFNDPGIAIQGASIAGSATSSTTSVELGSGRASFVAWAGEIASVMFSGYGSSNTPASVLYLSIGIDSVVSPAFPPSVVQCPASSPSYSFDMTNGGHGTLAGDGLHYATILASVNANVGTVGGGYLTGYVRGSR
jgi:hypothetical protein